MDRFSDNVSREHRFPSTCPNSGMGRKASSIPMCNFVSEGILESTARKAGT
jgi:hypothetical protein